jgi:hypothetical protein
MKEGNMKAKMKNVSHRVFLVGLCVVAIMFGFTTGSALAHEADPHPHAEDSKVGDTKYKHPEHGSLGDIGNKLANPLSALWQLSMSFNLPTFYDGDVNKGDGPVGAAMAFQPVLPIPLFGEGKSEWRMITRPIIPFVFSQPIPRGQNDFYNKGGIGDIQLPLLVNLPESIAGKFIVGAGPVFLFPTATSRSLGSNQWAMGPALVLGYHTKKTTFGIFPNYFWKIAKAGQNSDQANISKMSVLYFWNHMLPNAWQVGMNPTITFNNEASSGNKWNVPVGLYVGKTTKIGKFPVNIKVGLEYSVVHEDDYGKRAGFRIQITPVIPGLIQKPIFGK